MAAEQYVRRRLAPSVGQPVTPTRGSAFTQSSALRQRASACSRAVVACSPAAGYEPRNFTAALLGVQRAQGVGHQLVVDVGLGVDDEAVVAEPAGLRRSAEQVRQVDPPGGELLEDRDQAARLVGPLEHDHRRAVVARRRRDAVAGDEHEPGLVARVVGDVAGEHVEAVARGGDAWGDGDGARVAGLGDQTGGLGRAVGGADLGGRAGARGGTGGTGPWPRGSTARP